MLLDTSVLIAASVSGHLHNSVAIRTMASRADFSVAGHSLSEFYNTLTKPRGYGWSAQDAVKSVETAARRHRVLSLDAEQIVLGIALFAATGGIGGRLYDYLIGHHAVVHAIPAIVTLNDRDFRPLFPQLTVLTPARYLETL